MMSEHEQIEIARQVGLECAILACDKFKKEVSIDQIITLSNHFVKWMINMGYEKRTLIAKQGALKRACISIEINTNIKDSETILLTAETFFNYIIK